MPMTGLVVDKFSVTRGAGGPTASDSCLSVLAFEAPFTASTVNVTTPWLNGTVHVNPTWPVRSVVPVRASPTNVEFNHTFAPETGAKSCETNTSNLTVRPKSARSGAVSATAKTPVVGGGVVVPGRWSFDSDQKL